MPREQSYAVLLVSASEYRVDGAFRYAGSGLPEAGEVITVADELAGTERDARVRRVSPQEPFAIHAIDMTPLAPERRVAPREQSRRRSKEDGQRVFDGRRGWLSRRRRRSPHA